MNAREGERLGPAAAAVFAAATVVLLVAAVAGIALNTTGPEIASASRTGQVCFAVEPIFFALTGALLVLRRPRNLTAWALWVIAAAITAMTVPEGVLAQYEAGRRVPLLAAEWSKWLNDWTWVAMFAATIVLLMRFPDGRLPGRWWRLVEWVVIADTLLAVIISSGASSAEDDYPNVGLPVQIGVLHSLPGTLLDAWSMTTFTLLIASIAVTAAGLLIRFRRARGAERAQLQWLLAAAGLIAALFIIALVSEAIYGGEDHAPQAVQALSDTVIKLSLLSIPVAVAIAVTRHGLFEIGRVVSRTVSYALLVALLAAAYAGVVAAMSALVPDRLGSLPVVAATLAASALFLPVRRRVIRVVDRRFNRSRYDAEVVIARFAERVRGRAGQGTTSDDLVAAAQHVLQPAQASVWLMPPAQR